ncbi:hypothetical protein AKJ09_06992 [Labilithrix luteola]|uniref:Uncharacterized protein n=1 Tax=Labilithrix luteola TaxID=1391654 RepID=A0A0K1Q3I9_9BACT|nr:hypothetical protein AKJ09_06992 [Labilithrix luteola]
MPELAWPIEEFVVDDVLAVEVTFRRSRRVRKAKLDQAVLVESISVD